MFDNKNKFSSSLRCPTQDNTLLLTNEGKPIFLPFNANGMKFQVYTSACDEYYNVILLERGDLPILIQPASIKATFYFEFNKDRIQECLKMLKKENINKRCYKPIYYKPSANREVSFEDLAIYSNLSFSDGRIVPLDAKGYKKMICKFGERYIPNELYLYKNTLYTYNTKNYRFEKIPELSSLDIKKIPGYFDNNFIDALNKEVIFEEILKTKIKSGCPKKVN